VKETESRKGETEIESGKSGVWLLLCLCVREKKRKLGEREFKIVPVQLCERERQLEREHESRFDQKSNRTQEQRLGRYRVKECERQKKFQRTVREIDKV